MPKIKRAQSTLSGLIDSDSEDAQFVDAMPTPDSAAENRVPEKKARGRPKVAPTKVTKAKAPARRTSGRLTARLKPDNPMTTKSKRPALADKTNQQYASETEEVEDFEADEDVDMAGQDAEESVVAVKQPKPKATKTNVMAAGKSKSIKEASKTSPNVAAETPQILKPESRTTKKRGPSKKEIPADPSPEKVVMETQAPAMDIDADAEEDEIVEKTITRTAHNASRARSNSRHRQPSLQRRRAGSASDTERNDPALRRKLGEVTKKYENLHLKYQDLREIGLKEAERNFERLKKQSEERTKVSNNLIATLKADVAAQAALAKDSSGLKKKLDNQKNEIASLQAQLAKMTITLSEAQSENKTLSAKLAANRTAAASVESTASKATSSAVKSNGGIRMVGSAEAAQVAQAAQLKEDIYSDLTGLIIRSVKRETEEDIFDCIQTGRNGTLHFKLAAGNEKSAESYDDVQCSYIPQLDPSRDRALVELLPDYLVDEITFPRPQAAKFYARVVKALTEKAA